MSVSTLWGIYRRTCLARRQESAGESRESGGVSQRAEEAPRCNEDHGRCQRPKGREDAYAQRQRARERGAGRIRAPTGGVIGMRPCVDVDEPPSGDPLWRTAHHPCPSRATRHAVDWRVVRPVSWFSGFVQLRSSVHDRRSWSQ